jgi:large subunit ribosomal protein L10
MLREDKEAFVEKMQQDLQRAAGVLFVDFTGLTVEEADRLRIKYREAEVGYHVVKNTLMARALDAVGLPEAAECLKGSPTGVVIGYEDPVAAARLTFEFLKDSKHVRVKGGLVDKKPISSPQAEALSKMPGKRELQAEVLALAMSPASNLIKQFKSPAGRIVGAIDALVERGEE